ncbi:MAG: alanine racemase [Boseongicola sp.]|nr:alanine racemase [Boseongicola sp.]
MNAAELTIDLDAVAANWRALDAKSSQSVETAAVVKANGYGLDAGRVAARLAREGARTFFVAIAEEGKAVRTSVGPEARIFVFSGHMDGATDMLQQSNLIPLLNSAEQVTRHFAVSPSHAFGIQLDTGMNRLGMEQDDWDALRSELLANGPSLVMSHLACADEPGHQMNARQLEAFRAMTAGVNAPLSLAATGGTLLGSDYHFDLVRPGVGLYGGFPFKEAEPVVRLSAQVIQTREIQATETVGYGYAYIADEPRTIATIAAGYADGLIRAMGPKAQVYSGNTPCKVVGRVSMDLITVDVTNLEQVPASLDILSAHQTVDDLADAAGTIGYEILTSLGHRYGRTYRGST